MDKLFSKATGANIISGITGVVGASMGYIFGVENKSIITTLAIIIVLDLITGVSCAYVNKKWSSRCCKVGAIKKFGVFIIMALAYQLDILFNTRCIVSAMFLLFTTSESISILENWSNIGLPIPHKLIEVLIQVKDNSLNRCLDKLASLVETDSKCSKNSDKKSENITEIPSKNIEN